MNRAFKMLLLVPAVLALALGLAACSSDDGEYGGSVAATVNGENIYEEQVTEQVENYMSMFGADDPAVFAHTLYEMGMDPASLREQVIDSLAQGVVIRQAAANSGIKLDEAYVENTLSQYKSSYETDEAWEEYLANSGTTEAALRSQIEDSYFQQQVMQKLVSTPVPTDEQVQDAINDKIASYSGKRSSHILFNEEDKDKAEDVLQQLKNGADFAELAKENSQDTGSAENGGDVGWDNETSFVEEYQTALDGLSKGQMTQELVKSEYGYHIILCTDERSFDENTTYTKDNIPEDIYQEIYLDLQSSLQQEAYDAYVQQLQDEAEIVINDIPSNVPYNVTQEEAEEAAHAAEEAAAAEAAEAGEAGTEAAGDAAAEGTE